MLTEMIYRKVANRGVVIIVDVLTSLVEAGIPVVFWEVGMILGKENTF